MKTFNKAVAYVVAIVAFWFAWFSVLCPWVMTQESDLLAVAGIGLYVVGALIVIYGTLTTWKKELRLFWERIKGKIE